MKKYLPFILILIMVILILGLSFFDSSSSNVPSIKLASIITKVLHRLGEDGNSVSTINLILRKLAHFMEYLVLTILLSIGFLNTVKKQGYAFLFSAITAGFVSLIDEIFIQSFSGRNSNLFDIFVDFMGIGAGLIIFAMVLWLNVKSRK
ncbi:MAG: VanZ family protein [Ruminiclostridium sp.]|nr:VanZ family protein [Ruminiclostridium sp.]